MAEIIEVKVIEDERGSMGILDKPESLPFSVKRVLFIYGVEGERGGHGHKRTIQGLICIKGSCEIFVNNGIEKNNFILNSPEKCLILNPEDWHKMKLTKDAVLLALGSEYYDPEDYVKEEPI